MAKVMNEFKKQLLGECEVAKQVLVNSGQMLDANNHTPELLADIAAQLNAQLVELNGFDRKINAFLDARVQYAATEDERKVNFNEIMSHAEKKGLLTSLKKDIGTLLDQISQMLVEEASVDGQCEDRRQGHSIGGTQEARVTRSQSKQRGALCDGPSTSGDPRLVAPKLVPAPKLFDRPEEDENNKSVIIEKPEETYLPQILQRIQTLEEEIRSVKMEVNTDRATYRQNSEVIMTALQRLNTQMETFTAAGKPSETPENNWNNAPSQAAQCIGFNQSTGRPIMEQQPRATGVAQPTTNGIRNTEAEANKLVAIAAILKPFNGDATNYPIFISNFDHFVHHDDSIPKIMKQSILISKLEGQAAQEMQSAELSEANYDILRANLHRQYGQSKYQRDVLINKLQAIKFDKPTTKEVESALNNYCNVANKLKCFNVDINDQFFLRSFVKALPNELRTRIVKKYHEKDCSFDELSKAVYALLLQKVTIESFEDEVEVAKPDEILINALGDKREGRKFEDSRRKYFERKAKLTPPSKMVPCAYCGKEDHTAVECTLPIEEKREIASKKKLCMNCLSNKHFVKDCKSKFNCYHCKARHFSGHCNNTNIAPSKINKFAFIYDLSDDEELAEQLFRGKGAETLDL
ncbi:hypothetical protein B9Z55_019714 [Caenorhabditis nigoni]|uniref:CCHC-type domain-containing protein n=1 Tax=Caenorhabditis nigoni TaxID=1611254 RepID=A0A2G5TKC0_9PELO|nr:hypothetical protein B9Z55_019714 [Caenorhabditis nigoni]